MEGKRAQDKVGTVSYWEGSVNFQETENQMAHKCIVEENTQKFICLGCPVSAVFGPLILWPPLAVTLTFVGP